MRQQRHVKHKRIDFLSISEILKINVTNIKKKNQKTSKLYCGIYESTP
jgi:hypothetical protein